MIASAMWEDDFFTGLSVFNRLVWIGLITACADDQGRMQDSAALIRTRIFPLDDVKIADIEAALILFCEGGKITRYIAGNKKAIQIIAWWKHQTPNWAGKSTLLPPPEWADRERYHTTGNIIKTTNWDCVGGYIAGYIAPKIDTIVPSNSSRDVNVNGDDKSDGEGESNAHDPFFEMQSMIERLVGYPSTQRDIEPINEFVKRGAIEADLINSMTFLEGKKQVRGAADLKGSVLTAIAKRTQAQAISGNVHKRIAYDVLGKAVEID
jgi:hypothetical protein